jgi:hypothetical protein
MILKKNYGERDCESTAPVPIFTYKKKAVPILFQKRSPKPSEQDKRTRLFFNFILPISKTKKKNSNRTKRSLKSGFPTSHSALQLGLERKRGFRVQTDTIYSCCSPLSPSLCLSHGGVQHCSPSHGAAPGFGVLYRLQPSMA